LLPCISQSPPLLKEKNEKRKIGKERKEKERKEKIEKRKIGKERKEKERKEKNEKRKY